MKKIALALVGFASVASADVSSLGTAVTTELSGISTEIVTIGTIVIGISALYGIVKLFRRMAGSLG